MPDRVDVLWHCAALHSAEHAVVERSASGWRLSGSAALPVAGLPGHIDYALATNALWSVESADVTIWARATRIAHHFEHDDGTWHIDGRHRADLDGCRDLDLGWTPLTNTIPIRRLDLDVGASVEILAAWLRFPELDVVPNPQRYARTAVDRWRYHSGPFDFELAVDSNGIVVQYGDDLWQAVTVAVTA